MYVQNTYVTICVFRPIGVASVGSIPTHMIVGFIALTILRFFSLMYVLLDSNENCKENNMKRTKVTTVKQVNKMVGLLLSSGIETIWAIGVAVISSEILVT